ncbi:MAG: RND family transporter [Rhodothermales bacterium]
MDRFFQALRPFIRFVVNRSVWILLLALVLSFIGFQEARQLSVDTDFSKLIPPEYPSVQAIERLRATVGSESSVDVAIVSPSFEANERFAEALIPRALSLQGERYDEPYFSRVDYRRNTEFLKDNALYFSTSAELDQLETYLEDKIEESRLAANPFFFDLEDDEEDLEPDTTAEALQEAYNDIVGKDYPVSEDSMTMVVRFYPTGSQTNLGFIERLYADLDVLLTDMQPASFHPEMEIVTAGRPLRQLTEIKSIENDVKNSFGAGAGTVLLIVVLYFFFKGYRARSGGVFSSRLFFSELIRIPVLALLIAVPLLMSLSWTFGIAYLRFETLNLMTSTLGLVLFGLGIDFGIHFYARYTEERAMGKSVLEGIEETFISTGQAITIGALTTAAALYILVLADFRGFSEFGFIAGTGIIFALIAMLVVMPALISVFEKTGLLRLDVEGEPVVHVNEGKAFPGAKGIVIGSLAAVIAALIMVPRVEFEYDFGSLEPVYESYNERRDYVRRVFDNRKNRNPAYIVVDDPEEVAPITETIRANMVQDTLSPTINKLESMQDRFPTKEAAQTAKLERLAYIREMLDDQFLNEEESEDMDRLRRAAQTTAPISIDEVPDFLKTQFTSKSGEMGNFIIIYPSVGLSDGRQSIAFSEDVGRVETPDGKVYHAGSSSLVAADMLKLMQEEAPWMIFATFIIVLLLMWVNFGSVRWALLATLPLVVGVLWMLLVMEILGLKLNFYNLIVLPAVLGIGNDAGVHIVHRYREEGIGSIWAVLKSTGEHVTMGSLTTMIGFAGLLLSFHPGLHTIGELAVVGIGATLISALLFLPALLQWLEGRLKVKS